MCRIRTCQNSASMKQCGIIVAKITISIYCNLVSPVCLHRYFCASIFFMLLLYGGFGLPSRRFRWTYAIGPTLRRSGHVSCICWIGRVVSLPFQRTKVPPTHLASVVGSPNSNCLGNMTCEPRDPSDAVASCEQSIQYLASQHWNFIFFIW